MLQVKDRLGDFEIIRLLGKGGMGEVYEARQFNPDRPVALKVLAPWLANDEDALRRFWKEAEVPANLDHPGIVRIITTGKEDGVAYYTMQLVRGISLSELVRRTSLTPVSDVATRSMDVVTPSEAAPASRPNPSPPHGFDSTPPILHEYRRDRFTTLARIGAQAARALAHAHQQGQLHRDIKPSNLMVDLHDHVYLLDFGLTRCLEQKESGTQPGVIVGTPWYMSPEQAEGKPLDARSDIYSLGVTLFELASQGVGPFTASREDKKAVLEQVRRGERLSLRNLAPDIPAVLERVILGAMNPNPEKRYNDALQLAHDLEVCAGVESRNSDTPALKLSPWRFVGRRWIAAAVTLLALPLLVAVAFLPDRTPQEKPRNPASNPAPTGKLDGKLALPEILQHQQRNAPQELINRFMEPLWRERFYGAGQLNPYVKRGYEKLEITDFGKGDQTIFGIADPDRRNFTFSVALHRIVAPAGKHDEKKNQTGVIFGWQRRPANSIEHPRFFVVELAERPQSQEGFGSLKIGTAQLIPPTPERGTYSNDWYKPLPGGMDAIPLKWSNQKQPHVITVEIHNDEAYISVDAEKPLQVAMADLRKKDPHAARDLHMRGAIGIWTNNGAGIIKSARLTILPDN